MAVCTLSKDLLRSNYCGYTLNEIKKLWLANAEEVSGTTKGACSGGGVEVSDIAMSGTAQWYEITPAKNSASFSDSLVVTDQGAKYRTHSITFSFNGAYDCDMPDVVDALSLGKFIAVVEQADGSHVMLGRVGGLEADSDGANFGGPGEEAAGLTVTLSGNMAESILPVSDTAMAKITG